MSESRFLFILGSGMKPCSTQQPWTRLSAAVQTGASFYQRDAEDAGQVLSSRRRTRQAHSLRDSQTTAPHVFTKSPVRLHRVLV